MSLYGSYIIEPCSFLSCGNTTTLSTTNTSFVVPCPSREITMCRASYYYVLMCCCIYGICISIFIVVYFSTFINKGCTTLGYFSYLSGYVTLWTASATNFQVSSLGTNYIPVFWAEIFHTI